MVEIERKFKVKSDAFKQEAYSKQQISQGYLNSDPERTVRVRINGESGTLTIKGIGNETGMTRFEWEMEVSLSEAKPLLALCEKGAIEKIRYLVKSGLHIFEVDEFLSENSGLLIAEIELKSEDEEFERPLWLGDEVTNDERYYNSYLSRKPFKSWI